MPKDDFLIVRPFNTMFMIMLGFFLLVLVVSSAALRKTSEATRAMVLLVVSIITFICFFIYKYYLSIDTEYDNITANMGGFNWWGEFPLQLCNINMILIPLAIITKNKDLMGFAFFVGPLGAFMALAMPVNGFDGYSILLPRMLGFYSNHFMIVIQALALVTFGLYKPTFSDVPRIIATLFIISLIVFGINTLLRVSGLHPKANYFFSYDTEGNAILELFHKWIPIPFLYQIPCIGIFFIYVCAVMGIYTLITKIIK